MWQFCEQASKCCVQFASTLLLEGIPQYDRVRMLRTEKEHFAVPRKAPHSLNNGHPSLCMLRGWWLCTVRQSYDCAEYDLQPYGMEHPLICRWGCWRFMEVHLYDACRYSPLHC